MSYLSFPVVTGTLLIAFGVLRGLLSVTFRFLLFFNNLLAVSRNVAIAMSRSLTLDLCRVVSGEKKRLFFG